jgi:hypothetical protein
MMGRLVIGGMAVAALFVAHTLAYAQSAAKSPGATSTKASTAAAKKSRSTATKRPPSLATRTATCRTDCRTGSPHGLYRAYNTADPNLVSPEGRKMYAECVRLCLAPLPSFYLQKPIIEGGLWWFGMTKSDCLTCHATGETKGRATGVIMLPDNLRR